MSIEIIEQRLKFYQCKTRLDEINAIKEIAQEIALMALSKAEFFKVAEFHGGTALRIIYGMNRFSEDLEFALITPSSRFIIDNYLAHMEQDFRAYGFEISTTDRKDATKTVQKQFLKVDSFGSELNLIYPHDRSERKIKIKFEVDTNPPAGAKTELKYLTFPLAYSVLAKDLPSMFAGKIHALLCRSYEKGRDWYDLIWFISNKITVNFNLLTSALNQQGTWSGKSIKVDKDWLIENLSEKINQVNWQDIKQDVKPLLKANEQHSLNIWGKEFFVELVKSHNF